MHNHMRIVACAILVLSGAVCLGLSGAGHQGHYSAISSDAGLLLLAAGSLLFLIEFIRSWPDGAAFVEARKAALARIEDARRSPDTFEMPRSISDSDV